MSSPKLFMFDDQVLRVLGTPEKPLFVASDTCRLLGIQNPSDTLAKIVPDDEKGIEQIYTLGGDQQALVVTEPGLYRLIFRSDKPKAEAFRRWVFHEVLPQIRKTGGYELEARLWLAYEKAKTGKVQLALLAALGVQEPPARSVARPSLPDEPAIVPGQFWKDLLPCVEELIKRRAVRIRNGRELLLLPQVVLELLKPSVPYAALSRGDLLAALALAPEWAGVTKARFGPANTMVTVSCWAFAVTAESSPELREILERVVAP